MTGEPPQRLPGSGEAYNPGPPTVPRQAATVILLRPQASAFEVLMVRRSLQARFMSGVWVFPGGAVEDDERDLDQSHRLAARRELAEEAGIVLPEDAELVSLSRWITPSQVKVRFDTRFFLAELPERQEARVDGSECIDCRWLAPADALAAYNEGDFPLVLPTIKHLEMLAGFPTIAQLLDHARHHPGTPIQPKVVLQDGSPQILLPDDPGY